MTLLLVAAIPVAFAGLIAWISHQASRLNLGPALLFSLARLPIYAYGLGGALLFVGLISPNASPSDAGANVVGALLVGWAAGLAILYVASRLKSGRKG